MTAPVTVDDTAMEIAQRFASVLYLLTCVMPNREDAVGLLQEVATLPVDQRAGYVARAVWPNYDELPPCSQKRLPEVCREALNAAEQTAQRLADEAAERAAAQDREDRLAAGERRLAEAHALVAAAAA